MHNCTTAFRHSFCVKRIQVEQLRSALAAADAANAALGEVSPCCSFNRICQCILRDWSCRVYREQRIPSCVS